MSRRLLAVVAAIVVVAVVAVVVARPFGKGGAKVETAAVVKGPLESTIELAGTVSAKTTRTLAFGTAGTVASVPVEVGDNVVAGDVVATIDDAVAKAQLASAQAAATSADAALTSAKSRQQQDKDRNAAQVVLDADGASVAGAEAQVAGAKAQLAAAQAQLDATTLTSPIAGTVVSVGLSVGDRTGGPGIGGAGTVVVADLATLQVTSTASEIDVVNLKSGAAVTLTFDALPDLTVQGTICRIDRVGSGSGGVVEFPVTVCLDAQDPTLRVGMTANVSIVLAHVDDALIVPSQAIRTVDGKPTVRIQAADGTIRTVDVQVGISSGTRTQVVSGVAEGDKVVLGDVKTGG